MAKVKVFCHTCDGTGKLADEEYPSRKKVETICPECNGQKWVWSDDVVV